MSLSEEAWRERYRAAIRDYNGRIRAWAKQKGLAANLRGRIPAAIEEMYKQATGDDLTETLTRIERLRPPRAPTAYDWLRDPEWHHFLGAASFCLIWVDALDATDCLRMLTSLHPVPGVPASLEQVTSRPDRPAGDIMGAARIGNWTLVYEPYAGSSAGAESAARRLSGDGRQAVAYWQIAAFRERFLYCRDGELLTEFDPLFPNDRQGSQPDLLVPQMTDVGLLGHRPRDNALKALDLADRITNGAHAGPEVIGGPFPWSDRREAHDENAPRISLHAAPHRLLGPEGLGGRTYDHRYTERGRLHGSSHPIMSPRPGTSPTDVGHNVCHPCS